MFQVRLPIGEQAVVHLQLVPCFFQTHVGVHAGQQLLVTERLGDVIHAAVLKGVDFAFQIGPGR